MEKVVAVFRSAAERGLPCIVIGGNAVMLLGYTRITADLDLLIPENKRSEWLELLRTLNYRFFHGTEAFVQLESRDPGGFPVDLMFVDEQTWQNLLQEARPADLSGEPVLLPRPEHLVALKLHAASSPRRSKPVVDWEDIRQIVRICGLDPEEETFRTLILRYGERMPLPESNNSKKREPVSVDINLPVFTEPQKEHWPSSMTWADAMRHFAPLRERYMREFDSPEQRLRDKNPEPFRLP